MDNEDLNDDSASLEDCVPDAPRKGRPPKAVVAANTPGKRLKPGRPPGEAAAMKEFKARILTSPKSAKVLESIFNAALDDNHKNQAAAWKILVDRLAPLSNFEKTAGGKAAITINISGLNGEQVSIDGSNREIEDADYEEIEE